MSDINESKTAPATAEPDAINITVDENGKWDWSVFYTWDTFDQSGKAHTLDAAMRLVGEAIDNGRAKP